MKRSRADYEEDDKEQGLGEEEEEEEEVYMTVAERKRKAKEMLELKRTGRIARLMQKLPVRYVCVICMLCASVCACMNVCCRYLYIARSWL